ncbi:divergent polysaccharide deacetylase family protein [Paenibacillus sp. 1011MAR3C5]|uniref:divergent polysaccharide deacetylase family protein n=1 Tax=Paenibacillus sp. 1011MAR3C5 TaxID=1675787 RepID=UPI0037CC37BE
MNQNSGQPKRLTRAGLLLKRTSGLLMLAALLTAPVMADASVTQGLAEAGSKAADSHSLAIVIDDFGNGMPGTEEMLKLPVHITVAVMPFMPTTKEDAEAAHKLGHDVIVHMPMEPNKGLKKWLGPGAITADLSDEDVRRRIEEAIDNVPHAIGMNNHMGSKITADERIMRVVLTVCKERGLFFLDSRTTFKTVVPKIAEEVGITLLSNDVFLDDVYTEQHISKQVSVLRKHLETHDSAVTIGHVGPPGKKTATVLKQSIPGMQNIATFVKLSDMINGSMSDPFVLPNP